MYFFKDISHQFRQVQQVFLNQAKTKQLVLCAFISGIAGVLQAAGGLFPGIGYFISPLATAPILFCVMLSLPLGTMTFLLTNLLLLVLQPSELIVFPFTTGLLGLGTGAAFHFFKKRLSVIIAGAALLTLGIISLLYLFHFPVLGPDVSDSFSILTTAGIFLFAFIYNWVWVEISIILLKKLNQTRIL